ncbi:MAG: NUDIX hydrolase [Desulfobulbaceae bacterium]|nr:NUDIX hydrolase [Desulfobulbaceae bacterium]
MIARVNSRNALHQGRVFRLDKENITLSNGVNVDLEIIRHPGASAIVPLLNEDTLLMIRQYRHAVGDFIWEIPAGTLDADEAPIQCARRELVEETGYSADSWQKLGEICPLPGYSDERIHIFIASDLTPARQHLDVDEVLEVHEVDFKKAIEMILEGEIQDAKTIAALMIANLTKRKGRR